ncbi:hypothetical protein HK099_003548 [Clydaea vesicula]|uniref:Major facilitator superfamily (MFS) profile domain-containing protein n=1 Tax=Clydaea vesicula TaxID=447962 RepID=A0AAD5U1Y2_9FUNG|nr:hypothetical protein HK099_003548 [Clydaea vesicula]
MVEDTLEAPTLKGNITSFFLIGCAVGAVLVSFMADKLGRKKSIIIGGILFSLGGLGQALSPSLVWFFYLTRIISGVGIGILSMVVPLYISETAPTDVRGRMISVQQLMITIGIFVAALINTAIRAAQQGSETEWRLSLGMQVIPGGILILMMSFMPNSPRWLEDNNKSEAALVTLAKIRSQSTTSPAVASEYNEIREGVEYERQIGSATILELLKPGIINRILIACTLQFFQQWTGINVILYYASDLFKGMGFDYATASTKLNIINAAINIVGTFPGMYLIERIGRRRLLIFGGLGMGISHYMVCLFIGLSKGGNSSYSFGAVIFVYIFILFFSSTWGPVVWVYQSEIFPQRIRAKGTGIATFVNWTMNAIIAKATPLIIAAIDFKLYIIFGTTGITMAAFCIAFVPETMGKSLEEMETLFGSQVRIDGEQGFIQKSKT